ncbi:MAG: hypothetical protein ACRERE_32030 [Candidatus Entotheonellia bacterium]
MNNCNGGSETIEALAAMLNRGYENQIRFLDERFTQLDARLDTLDARVGKIEADLHGLRSEVVYRHEFEDALDHLKYLEKKLGIESGV